MNYHNSIEECITKADLNLEVINNALADIITANDNELQQFENEKINLCALQDLKRALELFYSASTQFNKYLPNPNEVEASKSDSIMNAIKGNPRLCDEICNAMRDFDFSSYELNECLKRFIFTSSFSDKRLKQICQILKLL